MLHVCNVHVNVHAAHIYVFTFLSLWLFPISLAKSEEGRMATQLNGKTPDFLNLAFMLVGVTKLQAVLNMKNLA